MTRILLPALLIPLAALALQWLLWPWLEPLAWFLFFPAVFLSASLGGLIGGLISTVVSALMVWFFFVPIRLSWVPERPSDIYSVGLFLVMGYLFSEVHERLRASREHSEDRFLATFEQAAVGIAHVAPDGNWLRVNNKLCEIVGYSREELLAIDFQHITHPDDLASDLQQAGELLCGAIDHYALEKRYIRKDGSLIWINLTGSLVRDDAGRPDYFIAVIEEIQARKAAEMALRESQANLHEAHRLAGLGHWKWDLVNDRHSWSEEIYRIYGRDPRLPPAIYPEVQQYFTAESWAGLAAAVELAMSEGRAYRCDAEVVRPDGSRRWITARGEATRSEDGSILDLHGTVQDITERKASEIELDRSAQRLRRLAEVVEQTAVVRSLPELMTLVRTATRELTGADGVTLIMNDNGYCHYVDEDAIGPLWKGQRFPLENCISGWAMLHARPAVIEDIYADERIPHEAYRPTFVKSLAMVPVGREQPVAAIGCYWQTRHLASAQELELQQALADAMSVGLVNLDLIQNLEQRVDQRTAELSAANQELESFAYAVSHDLRAPLRAMSGFSKALMEDYGDRLEGEARTFLDQITIASNRMGQLIDGLLTLSRSTRGELKRIRVDVSALAASVLEELQQGEPERQIQWEIAPDLWIRGDRSMVEVILRNLLGNAWKYTGATVEPLIRVYAPQRDDGRDWIGIADNGAGFEMAHSDKLFTPFQRLHRQDEFPGIGIGLATVIRIVNRHGGTIEAEGQPGRGARFTFTLSGAARIKHTSKEEN